ncbi:MAG: type II secretion system protein [Lachnospiraceae bacterium]
MNRLKKIMKKNHNNKGFSLVELIVVIAIMAVLVGILAPQFLKYVERSRQATDIKNVQEVITAIQIYYADEENAMPTSDVTYTYGTAPGTDAIGLALTDAGITSTEQKSDAWGVISVKLDVTTTAGTIIITVESDGDEDIKDKM